MTSTVLIVEQNKNQRLLLEEELAHEGYRTESVGSAQEALERLTRGTPDLVLLDLHLPGTSGLELLGRLAARWPGLPVVIHTADASYRGHLASRLATAYVVKNSDLRKLAQAIRQALGERRRHSPLSRAEQGPARCSLERRTGLAAEGVPLLSPA